MSVVPPEVLEPIIAAIAEIDPAHLDDREVVAFLAGISDCASAVLAHRPDLKAHADLVMDLANRAFLAAKVSQADALRWAADHLDHKAAISRPTDPGEPYAYAVAAFKGDATNLRFLADQVESGGLVVTTPREG